jgi:hypothetical protein
MRIVLSTVANINSWDNTLADVFNVYYISFGARFTFFCFRIIFRILRWAFSTSSCLRIEDHSASWTLKTSLLRYIIERFVLWTFFTSILHKDWTSQRTLLASVRFFIIKSGSKRTCLTNKYCGIKKWFLFWTFLT